MANGDQVDRLELIETVQRAMDTGDVAGLKRMLEMHTGLAEARDRDNNGLLVRLIEWPGHRPEAAGLARVLLEAGAKVDARCDGNAGTALSGAICSNEPEVAAVLLEFGADIDAPCGFEAGSIFELVDRFAQQLRDHSNMTRMVDVVRGHTGRRLPSRAKVGRAAPVMPYGDLAPTKSFYVDLLGFHLDYVEDDGEGQDRYLIFSRGNTELHFFRQSEPSTRCGACHVLADPIDDLYQEFLAAGLEVEREIRSQPWGLRDFIFRDPAGNHLEFGGPCPSQDEG